ncbi:MAG: hypothetical protein ABFC77_11150 [Thermoguttaceae bacterium]
MSFDEMHEVGLVKPCFAIRENDTRQFAAIGKPQHLTRRQAKKVGRFGLGE